MATLAYYRGRKAENPKARLQDRLICWWEGGPYSHVEYVEQVISTEGQNVVVRCWSASPRENELRLKEISMGPHWDFVEYPFICETEALKWLRSNRGAPYDWFGMLSVAWPLRFLRRWSKGHFCTRVMAIIARLDRTYIGPNELHATLEAQKPRAVQ
jgi:hypothetical protein